MLKIEIMILILILTWKVDLGEEKTELLLSWSLGLRDIGRGSGRSDITLTITMMMIKKMMMMVTMIRRSFWSFYLMLRRGSISPGDRHNMLPWNPLKTFPFSWNPLKHFLFPRNPLKHFIFLKSTPNISFLLKSTLNISFCPEINFKHFLFCQKKNWIFIPKENSTRFELRNPFPTWLAVKFWRHKPPLWAFEEPAPTSIAPFVGNWYSSFPSPPAICNFTFPDFESECCHQDNCAPFDVVNFTTCSCPTFPACSDVQWKQNWSSDWRLKTDNEGKWSNKDVQQQCTHWLP